MKTKRKIVILAVTAMMLLATMLTPASTADAKAADHDRSTFVERTINGGKTKPACPKDALGAPGACYVYVSKVLVLTFDNTWMYVCPEGSIEDSFGDCRRPVADAA